MNEIEFVVVDTETTGLFPERNDRIIEIALVRVNSQGKVIDEYSTLVNPNRDIGSSRIHGIYARDVAEAPFFSDIAGDLVARLSGAVIVGHNIWFDRRFLRSEIARLQAEVPDVPCLCTMSLSSYLAGDLPSRKLSACCDHFGISLTDAHSALADARAAASILQFGLAELERNRLLELTRPDWQGNFVDFQHSWPVFSTNGKAYTRESARASAAQGGQNESYITRLVASLPPAGITEPPVEPYLDLLDRVLEDRRITTDEAELLFSCAKELALTQENVLAIHQTYLSKLISIALIDGEVSEAERRDLNEVAALLDISPTTLETLFMQKPQQASEAVRNNGSNSEIAGKSVCFTGELVSQIHGKPLTRAVVENLASDAGLVVCRGVTKKLDMLVMADPYSMSGKAKKAQSYGTRILAEAVFLRMIGCVVD